MQSTRVFLVVLLLVILPSLNSTISAAQNVNNTASDSSVQFIYNTVTSLEWSSLVVINEENDRQGQTLVDLLSADTSRIPFTLTVLEWTVQDVYSKADIVSRQWYSTHALYSMYSNFILLGSFQFVCGVFKMVVDNDDHATFTTRWLTVVPQEGMPSLLQAVKNFHNVAVVSQADELLGGEEIQIVLSTLIHQGESISFSNVSWWSPLQEYPEPIAAQQTTEMPVFPNLNCGLCGRTLRVVTMPWNPFTIRNVEGNNTWYTGLCMELLDLLATDLNFTYVISEPADQVWGSRLPNGTWAGMTGMLHRKEVDLAVAGFSMTADRASVSDYTVGFYSEDVVLISSRHDYAHIGGAFFSRPFQKVVYVLWGCGLVVTTALWVWLERMCFKVERIVDVSEDNRHKNAVPVSVAEAATALFGTLLARAVICERAVAHNSTRILLSAWFFVSIVTVATYTGKLTSNSVVTRQPLPFDSLSELLEQKDYTWGFSQVTMLESILSTTTNEDYRRFYQKALEFAEQDPDVLNPVMYPVIIDKLLNGHYVRLSSTSVYDYYKGKYCELTLLKETLFHDTLAVHLQKGSPYTKMLDKSITTAKEMGLVTQLTHKWFPSKEGCRNDAKTVVPISLELVRTAFIMAAVGLGLAAILLVLECSAKRWIAAGSAVTP